MLCLIGAWVSETFDCVSDPWACYVSAHFIRELKAPTMGRTLWVRRLNREIIVFNSKELDRLVLVCILLLGFLLVKLCVFGEYNYDIYIYTHTHTYICIYIYIIYKYTNICIYMYTHQQLRMTCTKLILWRSASRNTCDACIRIGGGSLPTNSCRSACVSLCGCAIACTRHASRSSRCLQVTKSLSETATLCHLVPFLKVEVKQLKVQKRRGVRFYYTCILSPLETSHPPLFHHALICQWLRKACHEYKNSGMYVAVRRDT